MTLFGITMFSPGTRRMAAQSFSLGLGQVGLGQVMPNWAELSLVMPGQAMLC